MKKLIFFFGLVVYFDKHTASPIFNTNVVGIFGNKFQGDIKLNKVQETFLLNNSKNQSLKTGWTWDGFRWPTDNQGLVIVPYRINSDEGFCKKYFLFLIPSVQN